MADSVILFLTRLWGSRLRSGLSVRCMRLVSVSPSSPSPVPVSVANAVVVVVVGAAAVTGIAVDRYLTDRRDGGFSTNRTAHVSSSIGSSAGACSDAEFPWCIAAGCSPAKLQIQFQFQLQLWFQLARQVGAHNWVQTR